MRSQMRPAAGNAATRATVNVELVWVTNRAWQPMCQQRVPAAQPLSTCLADRNVPELWSVVILAPKIATPPQSLAQSVAASARCAVHMEDAAWLAAR